MIAYSYLIISFWDAFLILMAAVKNIFKICDQIQQTHYNTNLKKCDNVHILNFAKNIINFTKYKIRKTPALSVGMLILKRSKSSFLENCT